jgi:hypothetical protein
MALFSKGSPESECGIVIDIGSGSVGIAIVYSENIAERMEVIWYHREYARISDERTQSEAQKDISTVLVNALLELGGNGLKTAHSYDPKLAIRYVQIAFSAPWAYTVTKTIQYEDEHPFLVDEHMIKELLVAAKKETLATAVDGKAIEELGLRTIAEETVNIEINGYSIRNPYGQNGRNVSISHITAVAEEKLLSTLEDGIQKILPRATIDAYSFMYLFYRAIKDLHPHTSEICLIDITNETTEIGIMRDNVLRHTTYIPFGLYTLAREIAKICDIPKEEAFAYIKDGRDIHEGPWSEEKKQSVEKVFEEYETQMAELFAETGDALSIPKTLFLHTSKNTEDFFSERIKAAAKKATGATHTVHLFTSELIGNMAVEDTALALSVYNFHTRELYKPLLEA